MRGLIMGVFFLAGITSAQAAKLDLNRFVTSPSPPIEVATACLFEDAYTTGTGKFCVYDCGGYNKDCTY
jgi:hypothetical protein